MIFTNYSKCAELSESEVTAIDGVISHFEDTKAASMEESRRQLIDAIKRKPEMTSQEKEELAEKILAQMAANNDAIELQKQKQLAKVSAFAIGTTLLQNCFA